MKKWIILCGALLTALLLLVFCSKVEFDNPLDKKGTNYLFCKENNSCDEVDTAEASKIKENEDGQSAIFDPAKNGPWLCDDKDPKLELLGPQTVTIETNQLEEFTKWVGNRAGDRWKDVVEGEKDIPISAKLTRGGTEEVPTNVMPAPGNYIIIYTAVKNVCDNKVPSTSVNRGLLINQYVPPNTSRPSVQLRGQELVSVNIGDKYTDPGVTVRDGNGTTEIPLTSIVITNSRGIQIETISPITATQTALNTLGDKLSERNTAEGTFTVTYKVTSPTNQLRDSVDRTVEFTRRSDVGLPMPVIVLNTYKHVISGKTIEHADTAFRIGGSYVEKGVKEAYYIKDGNKVSIPVNLVEVVPPNITGSSPRQNYATYKLPASSGNYRALSPDLTRSVYTYYGDCDNVVAPTIDWRDGGGDQLTLKVSTVTWNFSDSWNVTAGPGDDEGGSSLRRYIVDLGGMASVVPSGKNNLEAELKVGTYTVTYVGLNGCGAMAVRTRTVKVE